ncbi:hypothetical protein BGZ83_000330 [Gryganskiella cystojenkinii]|nr:hypothetical protein BGZ83_000330 [Gryganskiella cystojenkinii]
MNYDLDVEKPPSVKVFAFPELLDLIQVYIHSNTDLVSLTQVCKSFALSVGPLLWHTVEIKTKRQHFLFVDTPEVQDAIQKYASNHIHVIRLQTPKSLVPFLKVNQPLLQLHTLEFPWPRRLWFEEMNIPDNLTARARSHLLTEEELARGADQDTGSFYLDQEFLHRTRRAMISTLLNDADKHDGDVDHDLNTNVSTYPPSTTTKACPTFNAAIDRSWSAMAKSSFWLQKRRLAVVKDAQDRVHLSCAAIHAANRFLLVHQNLSFIRESQAFMARTRKTLEKLYEGRLEEPSNLSSSSCSSTIAPVQYLTLEETISRLQDTLTQDLLNQHKIILDLDRITEDMNTTMLDSLLPPFPEEKTMARLALQEETEIKILLYRELSKTMLSERCPNPLARQIVEQARDAAIARFHMYQQILQSQKQQQHRAFQLSRDLQLTGMMARSFTRRPRGLRLRPRLISQPLQPPAQPQHQPGAQGSNANPVWPIQLTPQERRDQLQDRWWHLEQRLTEYQHMRIGRESQEHFDQEASVQVLQRILAQPPMHHQTQQQYQPPVPPLPIPQQPPTQHQQLQHEPQDSPPPSLPSSPPPQELPPAFTAAPVPISSTSISPSSLSSLPTLSPSNSTRTILDGMQAYLAQEFAELSSALLAGNNDSTTNEDSTSDVNDIETTENDGSTINEHPPTSTASAASTAAAATVIAVPVQNPFTAPSLDHLLSPGYVMSPRLTDASGTRLLWDYVEIPADYDNFLVPFLNHGCCPNLHSFGSIAFPFKSLSLLQSLSSSSSFPSCSSSLRTLSMVTPAQVCRVELREFLFFLQNFPSRVTTFRFGAEAELVQDDQEAAAMPGFDEDDDFDMATGGGQGGQGGQGLFGLMDVELVEFLMDSAPLQWSSPLRLRTLLLEGTFTRLNTVIWPKFLGRCHDLRSLSLMVYPGTLLHQLAVAFKDENMCPCLQELTITGGIQGQDEMMSEFLEACSATANISSDSNNSGGTPARKRLGVKRLRLTNTGLFQQRSFETLVRCYSKTMTHLSVHECRGVLSLSFRTGIPFYVDLDDVDQVLPPLQPGPPRPRRPILRILNTFESLEVVDIRPGNHVHLADTPPHVLPLMESQNCYLDSQTLLDHHDLVLQESERSTLFFSSAASSEFGPARLPFLPWGCFKTLRVLKVVIGGDALFRIDYWTVFQEDGNGNGNDIVSGDNGHGGEAGGGRDFEATLSSNQIKILECLGCLTTLEELHLGSDPPLRYTKAMEEADAKEEQRRVEQVIAAAAAATAATMASDAGTTTASGTNYVVPAPPAKARPALKSFVNIPSSSLGHYVSDDGQDPGQEQQPQESWLTWTKRLYQERERNFQQSDRQFHSLLLTLETGLDELRDLKSLRVFHLGRMDHYICIPEMRWIKEHWPAIKEIPGLKRIGWQPQVEGRWIKTHAPHWRYS